jgi:hypothetical protein
LRAFIIVCAKIAFTLSDNCTSVAGPRLSPVAVFETSEAVGLVEEEDGVLAGNNPAGLPPVAETVPIALMRAPPKMS